MLLQKLKSPGQIEIERGNNAEGGPTLELYNSGEEGKNTLGKCRTEILDAFKEMTGKIKEGGNLVITGCNSGFGEKGEKLGGEITKMTEGRINTFLNQDMSAMAFQIDNNNKPTGYGVIGTKSGLTSPGKLVGGWRKFTMDENGNIVMKNLKDTKGNTGNLRLNTYSGPAVEIIKKPTTN